MKLIPVLAIAALLPATAFADDAIPPSRDGFEAAVKARMGALLRDPESARYVATSDVRRFDFDFGFGDKRTGWGSCYTVNAKNGYGGYAGPQRYLFVIQDGTQTVTYIDEDSTGNERSALDRECPPQR